MSNLPTSLREELTTEFDLDLPREKKRQVSADGAVKFGFELKDGECIEAVWIPEPKRTTLCVSVQAGCRMACRFCRTGQGGLARNLDAAEIVGQVLAATQARARPGNLVFMGMGEPLDNLAAVVPSLKLLVSKEALNYSPRRITVSTIGLLPGLIELGQQVPRGVKPALSLHSAVSATREFLMPATRRQDLDELKSALGSYPLLPGGRLTVEVVLAAGVNDSPAEARALARWLSGLRAKVNLIPFNPFPGSSLTAPTENAILKYQDLLRQKQIPAFIRRSRGADILAACGQLRAEAADGVNGAG